MRITSLLYTWKMCGIVGQFGLSIDEAWVNQELLNLRHRGPDNQSKLRIQENLIMGSTRLAMTDPKPRSNQPMSNDLVGSYLTFNGEIYNYKNLRSRLLNQGISFQTESDTEVLLKWLDVFGESGIADLNGMFAFAYFSKSRQELILARDHLGKKPLFILEQANDIYWSSSISSLLFKQVNNKLSHDGVLEYFSLGYTLDPNSIIQEIHSIQPGQARTFSIGREIRRESYVPKMVSRDNLRKELTQAVATRIEGHENVALSLSGGLDSTIVAIILAELGVPFSTYTANWNDSDKMRYNTDATVAMSIASKLGVPHKQVEMIKASEMPAELDKFVLTMGEPNNNPSGLSMLRLYEEVSLDGIRLMLTGDGADELFGGYSRHLKTAKMKQIIPIPNSVQTWIAEKGRSKFNRILQNIAITQAGPKDPLAWLHWHLVFRPAELEKLFAGLFTRADVTKCLVNNVRVMSKLEEANSHVEGLLSRDSKIWLANESNRKLDRISMEYSIEARSPFQDDFVISKSKSMMGKLDFRVLNKELLRSEFPEVEKLGVRKDKAGFTSPVGHWLRNNKEFLASSLNELNHYGVFTERYLRKLNSAPDSGSYQFIMQAWTSLVFARWLRSISNGVEF